MAQSRLFSESWHRVATYSVQLKPDIAAHKQVYRGETWYVLQDRFNNKFFRLRKAAYEFLVRLRKDRTVEEVWKECLDLNPDEAPGQDEVIQQLAQLYQANLISSNLPPDSSKLFERFKEAKKKEFEGQLKSFLTPRFPIFDPDKILLTCTPFARFAISPWGIAIWWGVVLWAIKLVFDNFLEFKNSAENVITPGNLIYLYISSAIIKLIHEFGHGLACRVKNGQVHTLGVIMMILMPMPYIDTTSSYAFRSRADRILVASAGMLTEFFIAALATFIWASSTSGLIHDLSYNVIFICSVTTLLFNINPLLKFDGYFILSDLIDIPNLQERSLQQIKFLAEHYFLGVRNAQSPAENRSESWLLTLYGIGSFVYKLVLLVIILEVVADMFLGIGFLIAFVLFILWVIIPAVKLVNYLLHDPQLHTNRPRALAASGIALAVLIIFTAVLPFPNTFKAPGLVKAQDENGVFASSDGTVAEVVTPSSTIVKKGQILVVTTNESIAHQIEAKNARLDELAIRKNRLLETSRFSSLTSINQEAEVALNSLRELEGKQRDLIIRAPEDGTWYCPNSDSLVHTLLVRGNQIGTVVRPHHFVFAAVVHQHDASNFLTHGSTIQGEVRLVGEAEKAIKVSKINFIPAQQETLPYAAIGSKMGGEIEVKADDPDGLKTVEPYYLVQATLESRDDVNLLHQRTGQICFKLPWEPLLWQWQRRILQFFQKRYQI